MLERGPSKCFAYTRSNESVFICSALFLYKKKKKSSENSAATRTDISLGPTRNEARRGMTSSTLLSVTHLYEHVCIYIRISNPEQGFLSFPKPLYSVYPSADIALKARWTRHPSIFRHVTTLPQTPTRRVRGQLMKARRVIGPARA